MVIPSAFPDYSDPAINYPRHLYLESLSLLFIVVLVFLSLPLFLSSIAA